MPANNDELKGLRQLLKTLEDGEMKVSSSGKDKTQEMIKDLKAEINLIESLVARLREGTPSAQRP